jgi:hypothetical protein
MIGYLKGLVTRQRTVDDIVRPLTTIVDRLERHAEDQHTKAAEHQGHVELHRQAARNAADTAVQAVELRNKIAQLVS